MTLRELDPLFGNWRQSRRRRPTPWKDVDAERLLLGPNPSQQRALKITSLWIVSTAKRGAL